MHLPEKFQKEMEILLGDEYQAFKESYDRQPENGLRLNRRKVTGEEFLTRTPFLLKKIPWIDNGYTYGTGTPAKDPYYYAGLYYLQEPSAMTPANRLSPEPGDYVLDLCAAPGGKATELGAKLNGEGLLLANDISNSRAKALLKNLELMGIPNIYVTSETSEKLAKILPEFFDKILVDAPCSGEGMFRKEPRMMADWEQQGPEYYSKLQREIILDAADMLRPGGKLLYSTCTFSELENEGTIQYLLEQRPDMKLIPCAPYEGFAKGRRGLEACVRIFPHRMNGEGHFLALLEKQGEPRNRKKATGKNSVIPTEAKEFLKNWGMYKREWQYYLRDERLYALGKKDGMPENLDPRALKIFCLPDDENAENYIDKYNDRTAKDFVLYTVDENGNPIPNKDNPGEIKIDATRCWNGYPAGSRGGWSPTLAYNQLVTNGYGPGCTLPMLGKDYCKGKSRIFFAAWETYFLLAEASLYGWNTGTTAKEAYENGIKASFEYFGVSEYVNDYLNSTNYNRVGTSVKFDHTTEPTAEQMTYVDGYSKEQKTVTYEYPTASKTLYGKALNDHLTKIITQKFIAQTPYLVLEMWSDFRRLGLPFFEIPANESSMTGSDMVNVWNPNSWKDGQKWEFYPQRMRYPSSLENADPEGYKQAVELLGGSDNIITPLWWTGR